MVKELYPGLHRTAAVPWELGSGLGNHRVLVRVGSATPYALVSVGLRRRDLHPERIGMRVVHMASGKEIGNVSVLSAGREACRVLFEAPEAGEYAVYYMPFTIGGKCWYIPVVDYRKPEDMRPDPAWLAGFDGRAGKAAVTAVESRTGFDSFYPMEAPMTRAETEAFVSPYQDRPFMLVAEDRRRPVMMLREFPEIWKVRVDPLRLSGEAYRNEYYVFQIAVCAFEDLEDVTVAFSGPDGRPAEACACFNAGGTDWLGRPFAKTISVKMGEILPLWCGVDVEKADAAGELNLRASVTASGHTQTVDIKLSVRDEELPDKGDGDIGRLARLRWLDSTIGLDDEPAAGYEPAGVEGLDITVLGRKVRFGGDGLPHEIISFFTHDNAGVSQTAHPILAGPVSLEIVKDAAAVPLSPEGAAVTRRGGGSVRVAGGMSGEGLSVRTETVMEYDGHLDTAVTVTALADIDLDDIALVVPYEKSAAAYMMGMGAEGGTRPSCWQYRWRADRANNYLWMGAANAGLHVKLKHTQDVWEIGNYLKTGLPDSWCNGGKGGARVREKEDCVEFRGYSGARRLSAGESVRFRFSLLVTPLKTIDYEAHWNTRYHHIDTWNQPVPSVEEAARVGARAVILHQGGALLPYINYPFYFTDRLKEQIDAAHRAGLKYKFYYTVRELSNHAAELPALRALGDEVLRSGPGFHIADHFAPGAQPDTTGGPWLMEHLPEGYVPAWQQLLADGDYDCALATTGLSRWHNYYLEGLSWLVRELGLDGLYLDGIGYDRQIMKRVRKVLDRAKPGCLIDFHSGNNYEPVYGMGNPLCAYLECMPSVDSLWLGEGYDYEAKPADYWLTEVSGIPFGLMGEMLHGGGNPWRGMIFGMSCRYGWQQGGDPTPIWRFWDEYRLKDCRMLGFWNPECPVSANTSLIKATAYVSEERVIIAAASWERETEAGSSRRMLLNVDTEALGLPEDYVLTCPAIRDFQEASAWRAGDFIDIEPGKGKIFVIGR